MFDVDQFKCWMFPCRQSDLINQQLNAEQQRKIQEALKQKREQNEREQKIWKRFINASASEMGALVYSFTNNTHHAHSK